MRNYSVPIYDVADAQVGYYIYAYQSGSGRYSFGLPWERPTTNGSLQAGPNGIRAGDKIPWNPNWTPSPGSDGIIAIVNYDTGEAWNFFKADLPNVSCIGLENINFANSNGSAGLLGGVVKPGNPLFDSSNVQHRCFASGAHYQNIYIDPGTASDRGAGFAKLATVTRAAEVESGAINHAIEMTLFNQMFGPECTPNNSLTASGAGDTCAVFQSPGSKVEHSTFANTACGNDQPFNNDAVRARTIPSGQRFSLNITDAEIESWLISRGFTEPLKKTARIFAVAMREYGIIAAETGCGNRPAIETDGMVNPATRTKWLALGLTDPSPAQGGYDGDSDGKTDYPSMDLLWNGLITKSRLRLVNPQ